ncbi:Fic family protein [bacterium]|nr:Fic family protein [bacterium]
MAQDNQEGVKLRPAGYAALIQRYGLEVIPNWHSSLVATSGIHRVNKTRAGIEEVYAPKYWPGDSLGAHLEFACKYDGLNLAILAALFEVVSETDFVTYIQSKPTGKYARRLWFLWEFLTGKILPLEDVQQGNYVDLLEPDRYYAISPARQVRRQRINDNLLGNRLFCPVVRRTETLQHFEQDDLAKRCRQVVSGYTDEIMKRALGYLYSKETKSSFEIEHISPDSNRTERFIAQLELAEREDFCNREKLIDLQRRILDSRFAESDYRTSQNYVGETVSHQQENIHFICPKPDDLEGLMEGLIASHLNMEDHGISAVIHAAAVSYGFVFLHPFEDGNGRIHRFLIHNILARRGFSPQGIMFPISATMLKNLGEYNTSLEAYSQSLMPLVQYALTQEGRMTVHNQTAVWYRFIDMTQQAEALFQFITLTIETELVQELQFLVNYVKTKEAMQEIVDLPDRQIDLFIRFCLQNKGRLSARKQASYFANLTDDEIAQLEQAFQSAYGSPPLHSGP